MTDKTQQIYYNLLLQGYMFRLLRVIIRPSNEPTQDYLIHSALCYPEALTMCGVIVMEVHVNHATETSPESHPPPTEQQYAVTATQVSGQSPPYTSTIPE